MTSGFQTLTIYERRLYITSFLNTFLHSIVMLLYYQYYYWFLMYCFCYFIISLFYHTHFNCFDWSFLCYYLESFLKFCYFAAYFGQLFLYLISFFMSSFYKTLPHSKCHFMHIFYVTLRSTLFLCAGIVLNDSMSFCSFSHSFDDISKVTVFKQ